MKLIHDHYSIVLYLLYSIVTRPPRDNSSHNHCPETHKCPLIIPFPQTKWKHQLVSNMPRAKTTPFKTALTEHVHTVSDAKGRKVPAISILWKPDAYNTITHNAYKNKSNDAEFCILFSTFIHHHIDPKTQKLVVNEGYGKNDTRVISKNIRHAPAIMEFFQEYEQYGKAEAKQMTITIFDNPRKQDSSGFLTLTFNGGVELGDMPEDMKKMQYLHVVNGLSPTTPSTGSSLVKSFPQTEFVFLQEDVDRYIQFIKDVAVYYRYLQEFNKEASSAKAVLKSSFKQRLDVLAKKDQTGEKGEMVGGSGITTVAKKSDKKKKSVEKRTEEDPPSTSSTSQSTQQTVKVSDKKKRNGKRRQNESSASSDESVTEKKRKLTSLAVTLEAKKRDIVKMSTEGKTSHKGEKKNTGKSAVIKEVTVIDEESGEKSDVEGGEEEENDGECEEDGADGEESEEGNEDEEEDEEENDGEESSSEEEGGSEN